MLSYLFGLVSLICGIVILIDMFQHSVLKGIAGLLCFLYAIYYALFEFEHEKKWLIVLLALFGGGLGVVSHLLRL